MSLRMRSLLGSDIFLWEPSNFKAVSLDFSLFFKSSRSIRLVLETGSAAIASPISAEVERNSDDDTAGERGERIGMGTAMEAMEEAD